MSERSNRISKLLSSGISRASYIRAKLNVIIPSQIRALRLQRDDMTQKELANLANMAQPRISAMERPGETQFNIDTLVRLAAAFKVGIKVEFVPFSEMLAWENNYSQDAFNPAPIERDYRFLNPEYTANVVVLIQTTTTRDRDYYRPIRKIPPYPLNNWIGFVTSTDLEQRADWDQHEAFRDVFGSEGKIPPELLRNPVNQGTWSSLNGRYV